MRALVRERSPLDELDGLEIDLAHGDVLDRALGAPGDARRAARLPRRRPDVAARERRHDVSRSTSEARGSCSRRRCGPAWRAWCTRRRWPPSGPRAARLDGRRARRSSAPGATGCPTSTPSTRPRCEAMRLAAHGLPVVIVNPAHVFGAGDRHRSSTELVRRFLCGQIPAYVDGALNIVDADDVARGHLLADERGEVGERYILGNRNFTLDRLFADLGAAVGRRAAGDQAPAGRRARARARRRAGPRPPGGDHGRGPRLVAVVGLPLDQGQARARLAPRPPRGHPADDDRLVPRARARRASRRRARASRSRCAPRASACAPRPAC